MSRWPARSFRIETQLPPDQVAAALTTLLQSRRFWWRGREVNAYWGRVESDGFHFRRRLYPGTQDPFLPVIEGAVEASETGTVIEGTVRPASGGTVVLVAWLVGGVLLLYMVLAGVLVDPTVAGYLVFPLAFFALAYVAADLPVRIEAAFVHKAVTRVLQLAPQSEQALQPDAPDVGA